MLTGSEYTASLADGRLTYFDGHLVPDLMAEPAFDAPIRAIAAGYDRHYSAAPGATNPLVVAPRSPAELRERATVVHTMDLALAVTYGSLMTLLTAAPRMSGVDPVYKERLEAYVHDATHRDIRIAECITDAKGNRSLPPAQQHDPDVYVRVVDRKSDGVVIRGAKLHISAASLVHDLMVMPTKSMKPGEEDYSIACAVPVNSPGVRIVNTTFHPRGDDIRHFPVSSVHSMPDGFVIFDDVFVPEERVFLDGETANAAVFAHALGLWERLGGLTAMVTQADQLVGLAQLIAEANGLARVEPHPRQDRRDAHPCLAAASRARGSAHQLPCHTGGLLLPRRAVHQRGEVPGCCAIPPDGAASARHRRWFCAHLADDRRPREPRDGSVRREVHAHDGRVHLARTGCGCSMPSETSPPIPSVDGTW